MDCIYLNCRGKECFCHAQPIREREPVIWYKPTNQELENYCRKPEKWGSCPRHIAFGYYLETVSKSKQEGQ